MDIEPRPYASILSETYCPEDQKVGCESCDGEENCIIRIHDEEKCWLLDESCHVCEELEKHDDGDRGDHLFEREKDRRMMEGE